MDENMRDDVRRILVNIYGEHAVKNWVINEAVANVLIEYLLELGDCNGRMAWVPRPIAPGKKPLTELTKYAAGRMFKDIADNTPGCLHQSSASWRIKFQDASALSY